jgi:hypothetical protein
MRIPAIADWYQQEIAGHFVEGRRGNSRLVVSDATWPDEEVVIDPYQDLAFEIMRVAENSGGK